MKAVEDKNGRIGGAIMDFAAFLTTRPNPITVGAAFEVPPFLDLVIEWAKINNLSLDGADVLGWTEEEEDTCPDGGCESCGSNDGSC